MGIHSLSKTEVGDLIYSYKEHEVTDQLYDFGKILLDHVAHRSDRINAQSATVLAWATAILAFLFVNGGIGPHGRGIHPVFWHCLPTKTCVSRLTRPPRENHPVACHRHA
jgi:hypothetical protein